MKNLVLYLAAFVALASAVPAGASNADPFTGAWTSPDTDGDSVTFAISAQGADGTRSLQGFDPAAVACDGGPAVAHGSGTVTGDTLTALLTVRCNGSVHFVGTFYFTASGNTLLSNSSLAPYTRVGAAG